MGDDHGLPPNQDPVSWSYGLAMTNVFNMCPIFRRDHTCNPFLKRECPVHATLDGSVKLTKKGPAHHEFVDNIIASDAILKLRLAARSGRPFMLAVGFRRPHPDFRFPAPFLQFYPDAEDFPAAKHQVPDRSIPAISQRYLRSSLDNYTETNLRRYRLHYAATVSWVDSQFGRVVNELEALGLAQKTVVVVHADHGFSLGEQGQFEKFTTSEIGARVPLMIRDPSVPPAISDAVVELVDVMPTVMDLAGVPDLRGEALDGTSLRPLLNGDENGFGRLAFTMCARCPNHNRPSVNASEWGLSNHCLFKDRTMFSFMGLSIRTDRWRYTEWLWWDGAKEQPHWERPAAATELYDHLRDDGSDFDVMETHNLAGGPLHTGLIAEFSALLRRHYESFFAYKGPTALV